MEIGIEMGRGRGTEVEIDRRLERQRKRERSLYRNLNNLLKIIRNMTERCPTPDCWLKNEKSQESLCLISHYYGWNSPNDSAIDYCDYPEPLSRTQWPHMAWRLATSAASFPPKPLLLTIPPLKHSSLTSLLKCHIIRKTFPGHCYLKYTFPCHSLSPLCWVIFLHSSNIMFNVSLSVVCLSLLHEDWDFICVVSMYLAHGRPSINICWVNWWALCQGLGSLSGSFHEPFVLHLGPLLRAAQVFGMHQDP